MCFQTSDDPPEWYFLCHIFAIGNKNPYHKVKKFDEYSIIDDGFVATYT